VADRSSVDRAVDDARRWVVELGPHWVARFDQMHVDVRTWAEEVGVDPGSYEFRAAWCVATTFLHRMAGLLEPEDAPEPDEMSWVANVLASVGLWGSPPAEWGSGPEEWGSPLQE
jgi:hypothetical protein